MPKTLCSQGLLVGMTTMVVGLLVYMLCCVDWQNASDVARARNGETLALHLERSVAHNAVS